MRIDERTRERFREWQRQAGIAIGLRDCLAQFGMQNVVKLEAAGKNAVVCETNTNTERYVLRFVDHTALVDDNQGKRKTFLVKNGVIHKKCS